jgi:hypothetical protein
MLNCDAGELHVVARPAPAVTRISACARTGKRSARVYVPPSPTRQTSSA